MLALIGSDGLPEGCFHHILDLKTFPLGDDAQLFDLLCLYDGTETLFLLL